MMSRASFAGACVAGLVLLLVWYIPNKVELQSQSCHLAPLFADHLSMFVPPGEQRDSLDRFLGWFHEVSASFLWMQLSLVVAYLVDWSVGVEMYSVVVLGHIIKNFGKSFIGSPRGFWFCQEGHAIYCGTGYSLPSGHSMMSLLVVLFLLHKSRRASVLLASIVLELFVIFEIIYLGTHTSNDMIIGFAFGITWFSLYLLFEDYFRHHRGDYLKGASRKLVRVAVVVLWALVILEVFYLEKHEARIDAHTTHPVEWQQNYERYCRLGLGEAAMKMRNSTAFEKTALLLGLVLAEILRRVLRLHGFLDQQTPLLLRVIRTAAFFWVFSNTKMILKLVLGELPGNLRYLPLVVQPLLFAVVFPLLAHFARLGTFLGHAKHAKVE